MLIQRFLVVVATAISLCSYLALGVSVNIRQNGVKIMLVGDSISHGAEGDYTWRYRLWQWLRANNVNFDFVGPWQGTFEPAEPKPPQPPLLQGEAEPRTPDHVKGGYALDVDAGFDKDHFCHSGRQAAQMKNEIVAHISSYQPDYVLIALGFNDLGWWISGPDGLLSDMKTLIDNVRGVKGNVKFAIANVPHRTRINGRQDLIDNTNTYNAMLASSIPSWSTTDSPVYLVGFNENYKCGPDNCPAAFDGLHPNKLGEYEIAQAFSRVLNRNYGFGSSALDVPANLSPPSCPIPTNVRATTSPYGVAVTWDHVYGARGYNIRSKRSSFGDWTETWYALTTNRYNQIWVLEGETWEYQVRTSCGDASKSDYSGVASAVVRQAVAPGPKNVVVNPTQDGFSARWDPPDGNYNIQLYEVFTYDTDGGCVFLLSRGVKGNSITVSGLPSGHDHVIAISTWTDLGPGFPTTPWSVMPGSGMPATPRDLTVDTRDGVTVQLKFTGDGAPNYHAWVRNVNNASDYSKPDNTVVDDPCIGITFLFPGAWNYEFCVSAMNGNLESPKSNCVVASETITSGIGDCPAPAQADCGWGTPGNGGDGSGQPGVPGGGSPGGGGGGGGGSGGGGGNGGNGEVYIDPGIWRQPNPHITCSAPCDFILPPTVLPTPTTITLPPYTTDLEIVWTSNGQTTRSFQTTTVILPPITTQTISFYHQTFSGGPGFTFSPVPRINPPQTTVTNDKNPEVTRTITPSPYPTRKPQNDDDDRHYGGPFPHVTIDIGPPGPICSGGCGSPCLIGCGGGGIPCIPLINCPRGSDFQDPADPDKDNDDDDDDDDDDDEDPEVTCPFGPLESRPAVNPVELDPNAKIDLHYGEYPGTNDDDQSEKPGDSNPPSTPTATPRPTPTPTPTPTPAPAPATQRFWVFYVHYIDEINDYYQWQFFSIPLTTTSWSVCDTENAVICPDSGDECRSAPDGTLTEPPWPNGRYTATRGPADDCVYSGDGNGPGSLKCPDRDSVACKDAGPAEEIDCGGVIFASDFYAAVTCEW